MKRIFYKLVAIFIMFCVCLTVLSRGAYSLTLAKVKVTTSQSTNLDYTVEGEGTIRKKVQTPVFIEENLTINRLLVNVGQSVKAGNILLEIELSDLDSKISEQDRQIAILDNQISDIQANQSIAVQNKQKQMEVAENEYNRITQKVYAEIAAAETEMNHAYAVYEESLKKINESTEGAQTQEENGNELYSKYESKVEAYNSIVSSGEEQIQTVLNNLNSLDTIENVDSSADSLLIQRQEFEQIKEKLNKIKSSEGKILSPITGIIRSISITTGGISTQSAAIIVDNSDSELQMEASLSMDNKNYIKNGDVVLVEGTDGDGKTILDENSEIISVNEDLEKNILNLAIKINSNELAYGSTASFTKEIKSQIYQECLPLSCIREEKNQYFVYMVEEEDSILGKQKIAKKIYVDILEKDSTNAALEEGSLPENALIISESNKILEDGSRIKLQDEEGYNEENKD